MSGVGEQLDELHIMDRWGPEKIVCVSDRRTGMKGVLVIDNTARGMGKGGTRMSPTLTVTEVARLARVMTWKWAGVNLFYGGAKAGIRADPTSPDKEAILRSFVRALSNEVPREYVLGLDMGLTESDAAIVQDELGTREAAVGTPEELGGVPYDQWGVTGFGVTEAAAAAAAHRGREFGEMTVVIQGFGAVGAAAAKRADELGAKVVAVSNALGTIHDPRGLDVPALLESRDRLGDQCLAEWEGAPLRPLGTELGLEADVLIPAATQDVIDSSIAASLHASIVVEGANLPTDAKAQEVLASRGVTVVPDFIANAGGVIAAAFAMDARTSAFPVEPEPVFATIARKMADNTRLVLERTAAEGGTSHEMARRIAQARVAAAMALKSGGAVDPPDVAPTPGTVR